MKEIKIAGTTGRTPPVVRNASVQFQSALLCNFISALTDGGADAVTTNRRAAGCLFCIAGLQAPEQLHVTALTALRHRNQ